MTVDPFGTLVHSGKIFSADVNGTYRSLQRGSFQPLLRTTDDMMLRTSAAELFAASHNVPVSLIALKQQHDSE